MAYIHVDVDDVLNDMSVREIQDLVDDLYDDGYIPKQVQNKHIDDFSEACRKLIGQAWRLTKAEEEFIINISKRF